MVLVDTSVWIDFLRGTQNPQVDCFAEILEAEVPVFYTGMILQEVLQGFHTQAQKSTLKREFQKLMLLNPTLDDHLRAADLFTLCRSKGLMVRKSVDCLIAALAIEYHLRAPLKTYFCHQLALFSSIFVRDKSLLSLGAAKNCRFLDREKNCCVAV